MKLKVKVNGEWKEVPEKPRAVALGSNSYAGIGTKAIAIGCNTHATGSYSIAIGRNSSSAHS